MGARRAWSYSFSRIHETPSLLCPRGWLGSSATTAWKSGIAALTSPASASAMALSRRLVGSSSYDVPPTTCLVPTCSRELASGAAHDIVSAKADVRAVLASMFLRTRRFGEKVASFD